MIARHALPAASPGSTADKKFYPQITGLPALPAILWSAVGAQAPKLLPTPATLPLADVVVITWASAEWAAMEHVFVQSGTSMPYSSASADNWSGWVQYDEDLPPHPGASDWDYWGYYRLVEINSKRVLLFKSNTHLDWPGAPILSALIQRLCDVVKPSLIQSIGTAGGCRVGDKIGTVNAVSAATLYEAGKPPQTWPNYTNAYAAPWSIASASGFASLLFGIPASQSALQTLADQFNQFYGSDYALSTLNAGQLCTPAELPALNNLTATQVPLLTTSSFVVGTTSGNYAAFAVIEMDDAIIAQVCKQNQVSFGFMRNVSDPAQNASLPASVQGNWGSAVYDVFGFYTSYNGALTSWATLAAA